MPVFSETAIQISGVSTPSMSSVTIDCFTGANHSKISRQCRVVHGRMPHFITDAGILINTPLQRGVNALEVVVTVSTVLSCPLLHGHPVSMIDTRKCSF